jgi:putative hydrolase of the HAD superfamily
MPHKKTIFFDASGTLFYINQGVGHHYSRIAKTYGVLVDADYLDTRFHDIYAKSSHTVSEQSEKKWWRDIVTLVFEDVIFPADDTENSSFDLFFDEVYAFFQQGAEEEERAWTLFPETREVLEHLSALHYPLGIISNFDSRIETILKNLDIFHFFKTITYSTEAGFAKPSVHIFQQALKKAGCTAKDGIHIGDHLVFDIEGAENAGMQAFLIDRQGKQQRKQNEQQTGKNVIRDLREIYERI